MHEKLDPFYQPGFKSIARLCLLFLYAPVVILVIFSFNANRSVTIWTEASLKWYEYAFTFSGIQDAAIVSLKVAAVATIFATLLATGAALATTRTRAFSGQSMVFGVINLPLVVPEIVSAISLVSFFTLLSFESGLSRIMIAHTVFCIPFAYLPIRAQLEGLDINLEQAAQDLYATPFVSFYKITLPLIAPGIFAGAMLSFIMSMDDFIITYMLAGPGETTLPLYIYSSIKFGITPAINAISTVLLAVSIALITLVYLILRRRLFIH